MTSYLEVERVEPDGLARKCWRFVVLEFPRVHLDVYSEQTRKTKRHRKWDTHRGYTRIGSTRGWGVEWIKEPEVPADVVDEALEKLRAMVEFTRWRDR